MSASDVRVNLRGSAISVVDGVSLSIRAGEVLGIAGESGCGKTTLSLALLGHARRGLEIVGGHVWVADRDLLAMTDGELERARGSLVSYVPQEPGMALNPALRVGTQLRETADADRLGERASVDDAIAAVLEDVKLPSDDRTLRAFPHQLSGGQQQRVGVAMAFLNRPRLIVMDEPTTGLDVTTQARVLTMVRDMCLRHAAGVVYVSHDLAVIGSLADRVLVMYAGRAAEIGKVGDILDRSGHPYVRGLLRAVPEVGGRRVLVGIAGQSPDPADRVSGCAFAPRCTYAVAACAEPPPAVDLAGDHVSWCVRAADPALSGGEEGRALVERQVGDEAARSQLLEVRDVTAWHGSFAAVDRVSLNLASGTGLALVGESGSGKTTLARCIAGLHSSYEGQILVDGSVLQPKAKDRDRSARRAIQYVFQNPYASLNPRRSVGESLEQPLTEIMDIPRRELPERIRRAFDEVSLSPTIATRFPHQLSGGQRQRVAIARALVVEPDVLVCDEVTSALDVSVQAVIVALLDRLRRERGIALLFVTHNLALVSSVAQYVAVMEDGRVVESGTVEDVLQKPHSEIARALLADVPRLRERQALADTR